MNSSNKSDEPGGGSSSSSTMERMKKMLSSPITKKRVINTASSPQAPPSPLSSRRYLGVPLDELVLWEKSVVPKLVTKICTFIEREGLEQEGIFRVSGNAKIQERLRNSFDRSGDADLDEAGDVMAVAGLLKLFLRELPDCVIPQMLTARFVSDQEECIHNKPECLRRFKLLLHHLPPCNYHLLKYLCKFLTKVIQYEETNKMNPMALGIVFGPNLFRCSNGLEGLRQSGITNQVTLQFINNFDFLFNDPCAPANQAWAHEDASDTASEVQSTPRSARLSDDETLDTFRSASPFVLDSDRSDAGSSTCTTIPSPMLGLDAEMVEKTISNVVAQHLFGETSSSGSSDDSMHTDSTPKTPVAAPRRKKKPMESQLPDDDEMGKENRPDVEVAQTKQRVQMFDINGSESMKDGHKAKKHVTSLKTESVGKTGLWDEGNEDMDISSTTSKSSGSLDSPKLRPKPKPRGTKHQLSRTGDLHDNTLDQSTGESDDSGFATIQNPTLNTFKRAPGPKNRRTPSRHSLRRVYNNGQVEELTNIDEHDHGDSMDDDEDDDDSPHAITPLPRKKQFAVSPITVEDIIEDVNHNSKPSINFLDMYHSNIEDGTMDHSPTRAHKPYIPPLDLSILHEHGDGNEPIPAQQGPSLLMHSSRSYEGDVLLSPRMSKLKKKSNSPYDTDVPPSPPTEQSLFTTSATRIEEDISAITKQLTKKIQSCKRKIKMFEESFEQQQGYRPSQSDKASRPEIKRIMQELSRARKELRRVKEDLQNHQQMLTDSSPGSVGNDTPASEIPGMPTIEETLGALQRRLKEKREDCNRPEDLSLLHRDQTTEEKLAVQKALLQYESIHGRPGTKFAKELMKPLYDRYRAIKRILAKPVSPLDKIQNLETVPEGKQIDFPSPSTSSQSTNRDAFSEGSSRVDNPSADFLITQNVSLLLKDTLKPLMDSNVHADGDISPVDQGGTGTSWRANLHELSVPQLYEEQTKARNDKKRLRKTLRKFEEDFLQHTGRKVQKEDRSPMEAEYLEYKQIKARLKLLDALLSKHDAASTM